MFMQSSMTLNNIVALFGAMVVLAFIPSVSVLAVSARSAASGFIHGVFTTLGIVIGDILFILLAILGLAVLAEAMDGAVAMATIANGYLFIAKPDSAWVCAINVNSNHFAALIAGDDVVAEQTVPGSLCVPTNG